MLVRFVSRRAVWTEPADEIVKVEFRDRATAEIDLTPSVYTSTEADMVRLAAEHGVTAAMRPQAFDYADLIDPGSVSSRNCETEPPCFAYACRAHHELSFENVGELRAFVEERRTRWTLGRVPKKDVGDYVRARRREGDAEWLRALAEPRCAAWAGETNP